MPVRGRGSYWSKCTTNNISWWGWGGSGVYPFMLIPGNAGFDRFVSNKKGLPFLDITR